VGGKLNVSENCLDRHVAAGKGDKVAIVFEGAELVRGGGGSRCMTMPILREDVW